LSSQTVQTTVTASDEQLMIDLQSGNRDAFAELVERYHQDALRLAYYYAHNWEDARDLSQDAFIKVFQQAQSFDPVQSFRPWFFRILTNHVLNFLNRKKRVRFFSLFDRLNNDEDGSWVDKIAEPQSEESEFTNRELVWKALDQLTPEHRSVMILHEIEGLKEQEIAATLDCSLGTVKSRLHYARKKMKKILSHDVQGRK